jgi:hypothetical protein
MFSAASASSGSSDYCDLRFEGDSIQFDLDTSSTVRRQLTTVAVFRDPAAWYHVVCAMDSDNATAASRLRIWVNNQEQTLSTTLDSGVQGPINNTVAHRIGGRVDGSDIYFSGYLTNIHFIDGQALTPSSFTEVSATTGQLIPLAYTGTYGTNGFYLKFADNSTTAALGTDSSGNGNTWTTNNFSVTAGAGNDSMVDTPTSISATDTGVGGEVRGNYTILNALNKGSNVTLSNGNLESSHAGSSVHSRAVGTIGVSSNKWYFEATLTTLGGQWPAVGVAFSKSTDMATFVGSETGTVGYYAGGGANGGGGGRTYSTYTTGDVIGVAIDLDNSRVTFYKNGANAVTSGTTYESITAGEVYVPAVSGYGSSAAWVCNFGQRAFAYTAPSGFKALCDTNLPAPVVAKSNTVMNVALYTGNGGTQSISGLAFSPDLVWIKARSTSSYNHFLFDVIRGVNNELNSNTTDSEYTRPAPGSLTAFNSDGFALNTAIGVNDSSTTYVAWTWDAGTSTVSNTQGSITGGSQVRANPSAGFSVVTYTGNGTSGATVGHGLNVAPQLLIVKRRSSAGSTANWAVWHGSLTAGQNLFLNTTDSASAYSPSRFTSTLPTSTVFSVGGGDETNYSGGTFVCYAFSPVVGYSSFGVVTATGTTDGGFAYTGFRPRFLLYKNATSTGNWGIYDTARNPGNVCGNLLMPSSSSAEFTSIEFDLLSNGIKLRYAYTNGDQLVFAAFAENPFQYARAR